MIGIISDIHGNYTALTKVLAELDNLGVDKIICLGDIAGYYCQINQCCKILQDRNIFCLMGNHDWYLVTNEDCPRSNIVGGDLLSDRTCALQSAGGT